jgi:hypothetical protein
MPEKYFENVQSQDLRTQRLHFRILAERNKNIFNTDVSIVNFINESFNG